MVRINFAFSYESSDFSDYGFTKRLIETFIELVERFCIERFKLIFRVCDPKKTTKI